MLLSAPRLRPRARRSLAALALAVLVVTTGCQVEGAVTVTVDDDGSGTVEVAVGLDQAAQDRAGDLSAQLRVEDLEAGGWTVEGPVERDGFTWFTATKGFDRPQDLATVMAEVAGPQGAFRDFTLEKHRRFGGNRYSLDGQVVLEGAWAQFGDAELTALLGGRPLGVDLAALEQELGEPVDGTGSIHLVVDLPGADRTTTGEPVDGTAVWRFELGDDAQDVAAAAQDGTGLRIDAESSTTKWVPRLWAAAALCALTLGVGILVLQARRRRSTFSMRG